MATSYRSAPRVQLFDVRDFQGGLNLNADAFQLEDNESPDLLNVDLDPRGGFGIRQGVDRLNTTAATALPKNIWTFAKQDGTTNQVLVQQGNDFAYSTGGNFTDVNPDALTMTGTMRAATMKDVCLIQRDTEQLGIKWDGTTATVFAAFTFNDDITAPANNRLPLAKYIAAHMGYMWVANTKESGTAFPNRVRFSHPNQPMDWRTNDYIDIDTGADGDVIVGIVPMQDRLLVFKQNAVYAITGYDPSTFAVVPITREVGAVGQEAIAKSENAVYWFAWPHGVFKFDGKGVEYLFFKLHPLIDDSAISASDQTKIRLGWLNNRLWVSYPLSPSSTNNRVLVYDPNVGRGGAWTRYDIPVTAMIEWRVSGSVARFLGCHPTSNYVLKMHQAAYTDNYTGAVTNISSYYYTSWYDVGEAAIVKRWRRPDFVVDSDVAATFTVDCFVDYDPTLPKKTFQIEVLANATGMVWGSGVWGSGAWGGTSASGRQDIKRGPILASRARAVQLRVALLTAPSVQWSVNTIAFKYVPKRVR